MNNRKLRTAIVSLGLAIAAAGNAGQQVTSVQIRLQSLYKSMERAFQDKKVEPIAEIWTQDYTVMKPDGQKIDRKALLVGYKQRMGEMHDFKQPLTIQKLAVTGDKAIATVNAGWSAKTGDSNKGTGHTMALVATSRDTWVKTKAGWKLKRSDILTSVFTVDGKPVGTR